MLSLSFSTAATRPKTKGKQYLEMITMNKIAVQIELHKFQSIVNYFPRLIILQWIINIFISDVYINEAMAMAVAKEKKQQKIVGAYVLQ